METSDEKEWNAFMKKVFREVPVAAPSSDFTQTVLERISRETQAGPLPYKPLISKYVWMLLLAMFIIVTGLVYFGKIGMEIRLIPEELWGANPLSGMVDGIGDFDLSKTWIYAGIALALGVYVQLFYLKGHFDKRFSRPYAS